MNQHRIQIGMATVVALVALRLGLGCHFLYEGVWKIKHHDEFTAEPFLTQAKGPMSGVFYAMIPDIDGQQRLQADLEVDDSNPAKVQVHAKAVAARWKEIEGKFFAVYPTAPHDEADKVYDKHMKDVDQYLAGVWPEIKAHFEAVKRFQEGTANAGNTSFQKERRWQEMQKLRGEANVWLAELDTRQKAYQSALQSSVKADDRDERFLAASKNPFHWSRIEQINFAVTYGLSAIGICLVLGLCSRLAALGGSMFMLFVVMTQPAWPGIYPPDPAVVGHALLVNKDFVEMLALLVIASVPAGRWAGLDFFLYWIFGRCCCCKCKCGAAEPQKPAQVA